MLGDYPHTFCNIKEAKQQQSQQQTGERTGSYLVGHVLNLRQLLLMSMKPGFLMPGELLPLSINTNSITMKRIILKHSHYIRLLYRPTAQHIWPSLFGRYMTHIFSANEMSYRVDRGMRVSCIKAIIRVFYARSVPFLNTVKLLI